MPTINIRLLVEEKKRLQKVASDQGISLSAFLRQAAIINAQRVLGQFKISPVTNGKETQP